jgi:hypothetical protein
MDSSKYAKVSYLPKAFTGRLAGHKKQGAQENPTW